MKHSIFVSIHEFVFNGGILTQERQLFKETEYGTYEPLGWYSETGQCANPFVIVISQHNRTFQYNTELAFVEVECTPIYK